MHASEDDTSDLFFYTTTYNNQSPEYRAYNRIKHMQFKEKLDVTNTLSEKTSLSSNETYVYKALLNDRQYMITLTALTLVTTLSSIYIGFRFRKKHYSTDITAFDYDDNMVSAGVAIGAFAIFQLLAWGISYVTAFIM